MHFSLHAFPKKKTMSNFIAGETAAVKRAAG
jgi:hypothetical protein